MSGFSDPDSFHGEEGHVHHAMNRHLVWGLSSRMSSLTDGSAAALCLLHQVS